MSFQHYISYYTASDLIIEALNSMEHGNKGKGIEEIEFRPKNSEPRMIEGRRVDLEGGLSRNDYDEPFCAPGFWTSRMKCMICSGSTAFLVILFFILFGCSVHKINEGTVGIYFRSGALVDKVTYPGIHFALPFITDIERIKIRPRTDTLPGIKTITRDGIENEFHGVQVITDVKPTALVRLVKKFGLEFHETLVFDRIFEELRIFCANHTVDEVYNTMFLDIVDSVTQNVVDTIETLGDGGIKVYHLTIPKPQIPPDIAKNYKEVKVQWTEQLVATQQQKTEKIKKETQSIKAVLDAEREKKVLEIDIQKEILRKEGEKRLSTLENEIVKEREQNKADVEKYKKTQDAEANNALFTPDFVRLEMAKSMSQNTKFFFSGESSPLGAVLTKIMGEA